MNSIQENCPSPFDLEPMCFTVEPARVYNHARSVCQRISLPEIRVALGVAIPNEEYPKRILYGFRNPQYHTEYRDTWGLPSGSLTIEEFLRSGNPGVIPQILQRISGLKLGGIPLQLDQRIGWTGRIRLHENNPQIVGDYYLVMVDVKVNPMPSDSFPSASPAYTEFKWLTPDEHTDLIIKTPNHACGACSDLASIASRLDKL